MQALSQSQLKRLTAIHGWSGIVLGLLLYAVLVTGTVVVFESEIASWSVGGPRSTDQITASIDDKVRPLIDKVSKGYQQEVGVWVNEQGHLMVFPHGHARNPDTGEMSDIGTMFRADPITGDVLERHEGFIWEDQPAWAASALSRFLIDLHVQLYVPEPWGLILTGILGLSMMAAGATGFLLHRHLIRDLFVPVRRGERLVTSRDRHILAASWSLPFAFLLGFTGSYFSFAGSVGFPLLSMIAFGGDREAMAETLFEPPVVTDETRIPMADLDAMIAESSRITGSVPTYIGISRYGRADSRISIWHYPPAGTLQYVHNVFDGAKGQFLGRRPIVGNTPSTASDLAGLMAPLHFGHFAGVLSKSIWVGLGAAMSFVILSGLRLWIRRRQDDRLWRGFARAVTVVGYGLPLSILGCTYAYLLALPEDDPFWWTPAGFVFTALSAIALGFATHRDDQLSAIFRRIIAVGCLLLPVTRMAMGGTSWAEALAFNRGAVLSIDLMLLIGGGLLLFFCLRRKSRPGVPVRAAVPEPAE